MASSGPDNSQWLSVTEETLFLHDGLIRVTDLVELPQDVQAGNATAAPDNGHEVVTFDSKSPAELCEKLLAVCGNQNNEYSLLLEYRLNALRGLWLAQRQLAGEEQTEQDGLNHEETLALLKKQGIWQPGEQVSFSSRVSLLLIFPLLKSQSRSDPSLCCMTAELLLQCLRDCAPLSLTKEPSDCLNGLESLLCSWLEEGEGGATREGGASRSLQDVQQRENAAAALVALACARGSLKTLLHTAHLLQRLQTTLSHLLQGSLKTLLHTAHLLQRLQTTLSPLPVAELLFKLLQTEGGPGLTTSLLGSKHLLCWGFEDMLTNIDKGPDDKDKDSEIGRNLACDGCFLYTTNSEGRGLSKIGSGLHGTLRGFLYARNPQLEQGWVVWGGGRLVHRPANFDGKQKVLLNILSPHTLQCVASVPAPEEYVTSAAITTLALTSDGVYFYWVWSPALLSDKNVRNPPVYMDMFRLQSEINNPPMRNPPVYMDMFRLQDQSGSVVAVPLAPRVTMQRKEGDTSKSLNEALLSRLRPYTRSTSAASLIALTGGNTTPTGGAREETSTACSCGLSLKLLIIIIPISAMVRPKAVLCDVFQLPAAEAPDHKYTHFSNAASSCGLSLKLLRRTPIYTCGSTLVMLTAPPGSSSSSAARSLFGSGTSLSSLRVLATSLCFSTASGQYTNRCELVDAPTCSLARGASVQGLGVCYDAVNNLIWTCSGDWVDQWHNPGNQAPHHVCRRLGIDTAIREPPQVPNQAPHHVCRRLGIDTDIREPPQVPNQAPHHVCRRLGIDTDIREPPQVPNQYLTSTQPVPNQAPHHVCMRLGINVDIREPPQDNLVACPEVINQLMRHVGFSCCHQLTSDLLNTVLGKILLQQPNIDTRHLGCVCDILDSAVSNQDSRLTLCVLIVLQVIFKSFIFRNESEEEAMLVKKTRTLVWRLLTTSPCPRIQEEAANVCSAGHTVLYPDEEEQNKLLKLLLMEGEEKCGLGKLRDLILLDLADQLTHPTPATDKAAPPVRLKEDLVQLILKLCVRESCVLLRTCVAAEQQEFNTIVSSVPKASPCLRYIMAMLSHVMSAVVTVNNDKLGSEEQTKNNKLHEMIQGAVLGLATKVLLGCQEVLEVLLDVCRSFSASSAEDRECRFQGLERVAKATVLGHLLPVLMTSLTHGNLKYLPLVDALMPQLVQLVVLSSQCALLLKTQSTRPGGEEPPPTPTSDVVELIGGGKQTEEMKHDSEADAGFLFGVKIPAPWATGKSVESIHPVRDNYKFRETVQIPGARCLYLRFDPRCSSQYDYDKVRHVQRLLEIQESTALMTFAGPSTSCRKVAEYGGNTLGYGSRSVLGSGWPKDLVKVDGDTVTFSFEMRSGREHNTPDRAMWGFLITVRAQEASEDVSGGLPFLTDLALGLSVLACNMLHILYRGPEVTQEEQACRHLLKSRLLQRCVWKVESGTVISPVTPPPHLEGSELTLTQTTSGTDTEKEPSSSDEGTPMDEDVSVMGAVLPRIKLSPAIMHKLRKLSGRGALQFRPSIRDVLQPDVLEETVVSVVIKHLGLFEILQQLSVSEEGTQTADFQLLCDIMAETFKKLNALERQLQALAEMEQKWQKDVEEAGQGQLHDNTPFFLNFHLQETTRKDLALLCYLKEVELNVVDLEGTIKTLKELFDKDVAMAMKDGQEKPFLLKTRLLLEKLLARAELLLHVTIETEESGPGLARSMSQHPSGMPPGSDAPLVSPHLARSISAPSTFPDSGGVSQGRADLSSTGRWKRQRGQAVFLQELVVLFEWKRQRGQAVFLQELVEDRGKPDQPAHAVLLDQLFSFIGSSLEEHVSCSSFLSAASVRWQRGNSRKQALVHMVELLTAAARVGGATHLVSAVTSVLQHGPKVEELTCGGMVNQVREAFAETMTSVVQLASTYPVACSNSIGLLCVIPYTRAEERCLVRSGLVQLLDKLCSLSSYRDQSNTETQTMKQRVSAMAWAGFQVLSNRCVMWEDEEGAASAVEHSGLARQVSALLTNHLARATECSGDEAAGTEALQEVLSLLNNLSRSKLGKAILSQPACVSKLLSLLLDQRPSPKLVLIVLQLCRVALPLISAEDCEKIQLPCWGQDMHVFEGGIQDPAARIASLLLAKLGDYVVPGAQTALSLASPDHTQSSAPASAAVHGGTGERERLEETEAQDGRIAVYVHKREDQSSHEVIQPLLSCDGRPFRLGSGANMEKVVRMDRDLTRSGRAEVITEQRPLLGGIGAADASLKLLSSGRAEVITEQRPLLDGIGAADASLYVLPDRAASGRAEVITEQRPLLDGIGAADACLKLLSSGRAEVITEDAVTAIRRAAKWAQAGLVVSTGPPVDGTGQEGGTDRKRMASSAVCREKNAELARADPVRPFISGQVANSMAGEVIGLLHGLLTAPESSTAQIWASAVERVLTHALLSLPTLLSQSDVVLSPSSSGPAISDFLTTARQVVAALCALGGFRECVKPGTMVQVVAALCALGGFRECVKPGTMVQIAGEGMQALSAQVVSISEQQGVATVRFEGADKLTISSDTLQVPLSRIQPPKAEPLPLDQLSMTEKVIEAQKSLLAPQGGQCMPAIQASLPTGTDGSSALMAAVRVMAEIRTRWVQQSGVLVPQIRTRWVQQSGVLVPQGGQCMPAIQVSLPTGTDGSSALMAAVRVMAEIRTRWVQQSGVLVPQMVQGDSACRRSRPRFPPAPTGAPLSWQPSGSWQRSEPGRYSSRGF
ncbi:HECTD4 [Branchiostoma lanceolatum]|uniref:HECTD4 protein n=1 Tax=Branchiostoma lanceolatum TaxID=7740 RepID=A0A8J9YM88_BRALA|nr:HECTD4 [Branchiostoma lanceolatum]